VEPLEDRRLLSTYTFQPLAFLNDPAPGGGMFINDFEPGAFTHRGDTVFAADLTTPEAGDEGIFVSRHGRLAELARAGEPAPGGGTFGGFGSFSPASMNQQGDAAFTFGLEPFRMPIGVNAGVYRYSHSSNRVTPVEVPDVTPAPGGGVFRGAAFHANLNDRGDLAFAGIVDTDQGISGHLGVGVFRADRHDRIVNVASPGDAAPGGRVFDFARQPTLNSRGDVAFGGHLRGDECIDFGTSQDVEIHCADSSFLKEAGSGRILQIAHQGDPIPDSAGGGVYHYAFGPTVNDAGQVVFTGALSDPPGPVFGDSLGVFLYTHGRVIKVARPGDALPGGGHLLTTSFYVSNYDLNARGQVTFNAALREGGQGLYFWSGGSLRLVARTGDTIPGVGTIASFQFFTVPTPNGGALTNARGQILFGVSLSGGGGALVIATPRGEGGGDDGGNAPAPGGSPLVDAVDPEGQIAVALTRASAPGVVFRETAVAQGALPGGGALLGGVTAAPRELASWPNVLPVTLRAVGEGGLTRVPRSKLAASAGGAAGGLRDSLALDSQTGLPDAVLSAGLDRGPVA
jgi:hypothetical protein